MRVSGLLDNKVVIVTGAAGGIGAAAAAYFASQGAAVVATDVHEHASGEAARNLSAQGHGAMYIPADLLHEGEVARLFDESVRHFGRVDGAFCNAGVGAQQQVLGTDTDAFDRVMMVNVRGVFLCCKHAYRHMRKARTGSLVLTSSRVAVATYPQMVPYTASKGAVLSMARALAVDFGAEGIRVNAVLPGVTETPMFRKELADSGDPTGRRAYFERQSLLGGIAQPEDIAAAAAFLLSDAARFITGTSLVVDGGCLARLFEGPAQPS
jgi:meso-butanediol dehydrogenase/(S,S)-butanediol dehydrogenase/diacetyl reductase